MANLRKQNELLKAAINQDKTGLAKGLADIVKLMEGYEWIKEGRGPYAWDDDRYKAEVFNIISETLEIANKALRESGTVANQVAQGLFAPKNLWRVKNSRTPLADTGDYMSECWITNGEIELIVNEAASSEEITEICDKLNANIYLANKGHEFGMVFQEFGSDDDKLSREDCEKLSLALDLIERLSRRINEDTLLSMTYPIEQLLEHNGVNLNEQDL